MLAGAGDDSVVVTGRPGVDDAPAGFTVLGAGDDTSGWTGELDRDRVDLGAGDDAVSLVLLRGSTAAVDGREGHDSVGISTTSTHARWAVDLVSGAILTDTGVSVVASSFSGVRLGSAAVLLSVHGSPGPDSVSSSLPVDRLELRLGDGADSDAKPYACAGDLGPYVGVRQVGGRGSDMMRAPNRADTLLGGPDQDKADGNGGRARCEAEKKTSCERSDVSR